MRLRRQLRQWWRRRWPIYPKASAPDSVESARMANERAHRWRQRCHEAREQVRAVRTLTYAWEIAADEGLVEEGNDPATLKRAAKWVNAALDEALDRTVER